jgi:hypothetical protein
LLGCGGDSERLFGAGVEREGYCDRDNFFQAEAPADVERPTARRLLHLAIGATFPEQFERGLEGGHDAWRHDTGTAEDGLEEGRDLGEELEVFWNIFDAEEDVLVEGDELNISTEHKLAFGSKGEGKESRRTVLSKTLSTQLSLSSANHTAKPSLRPSTKPFTKLSGHFSTACEIEAGSQVAMVVFTGDTG